jgi:hypothetical protein
MFPTLASLPMFPSHFVMPLLLSLTLRRFHRWSWSG